MQSEQGQRRREALSRASRTLGELLATDNELAAALDRSPLILDAPAYLETIRAAHSEGGLPALRVEKRRRLACIAAADAAGEAPLEDVTGALADLAGACLQVALEGLDAPDDLAVMGMGKLGGRELNYYSDIDIMFVSAADPTPATKAAGELLRDLGDVSPQGRAFEIDTNLRPEGRSGPLVRSLDGYLEYYARWAEHWEHQALLKARPVAGNHNTGSDFVARTREFVFPSEVTPERVASIRKMKQRVEDQAALSARKSKGSDADDVKLGPGGIRDIEFSVQLLQLVHGAGDATVRSESTLDALGALVRGGYVAEEDGAGLATAYRWLRTVEHRLQLWQERRVRHLPPDEEERARVARAMGFKDSPHASALERFMESHSAVLADVRGRFEKLFYRPMVESLADGAGQGLSPEALRERLQVLGFRDVDSAARTIDGLVSGTSRRARLLRVLTPAFLRFLSSNPAPDAGLSAFLRVSEAISDRLDALGALRDNPPGLEFLARVLGSGRLLGDVLMHVPEELYTIADARGIDAERSRERLVHEGIASLNWREPEGRLDGLRRFKRREMLRVALADLSGSFDVEAVGRGLSHVAEACLEAALQDEKSSFAVVGMGKLGGSELNYSSDIDVMFVHDGDQAEAEGVAERLVTSIGEVTPEGQAFRIDAGLRPEGKSGPLVRSLGSYLEYYERWASHWEHQALLKARWVAGDRALGERLVAATRTYAWPERLSEQALSEIRHLKARMERERVTRGADPRRDLKMGPGGLADIEFAAQFLQLEHSYRVEEMRSATTLDVLDAASRSGLIVADSARHMADAYRFLMRLRDRLFFLVARPVNVLPPKPEDLEAAGIAMGFTEQPRQELEETYLRVTRRARRVAEPIIYGKSA